MNFNRDYIVLFEVIWALQGSDDARSLFYTAFFEVKKGDTGPESNYFLKKGNSLSTQLKTFQK